MYTLRKFVLMICAVLLLLAGCGQPGATPADQASAAPTPAETPAATPEAAPEPAHTLTVEIESEAVADNMLDEPSAIEMRIHLPPSYYEQPQRRFPVVYFLHGFGGHPGSIPPALLDINMPDNEFIVVEPSGHNSLGGSFYVNSPVTGRWEDFVTKEVIAYIDSTYRTIADRGGRGIAGFSMGAYSAVNLALKHPDLYSCMMAYGPGLIRAGHLQDAFPTWNNSFMNAYGAAFSPNLEGEAPYANIPQFDGTAADQQIIDDWMSGFGDIEEKIDAYIAAGQPLAAIKIVVGANEAYPWILDGSRAFAECMEEKGLDMTLVEFPGGHTIPFATIQEDFVDYFADNLVREP